MWTLCCGVWWVWKFSIFSCVRSLYCGVRGLWKISKSPVCGLCVWTFKIFKDPLCVDFEKKMKIPCVCGCGPPHCGVWRLWKSSKIHVYDSVCGVKVGGLWKFPRVMWIIFENPPIGNFPFVLERLIFWKKKTFKDFFPVWRDCSFWRQIPCPGDL